MKAKGELYELNFKYNALKSKNDKIKRESQIFKNKLKESYKNQRNLIIEKQVANDFQQKLTSQLDVVGRVLAEVLQQLFGQISDEVYSSINYAFLMAQVQNLKSGQPVG